MDIIVITNSNSKYGIVENIPFVDADMRDSICYVEVNINKGTKEEPLIKTEVVGAFPMKYKNLAIKFAALVRDERIF